MAHSIISRINKNIKNILSENNVNSRRDTGPGIWVSGLLPTAIIISQIKYPTSYKYKAATCISIGILLQTVISIVRTYYLQRLKTYDVIISSLVTFVLHFYFTLEGVIVSAANAFLSMYTYQKIILPLMKICPYSFTYGEATLVCQSFILFLVSFLVTNEHQSEQNCMNTGTIIIQFGILCLLAIITISYYRNVKNRPIEFISLVGFVVIFILLPCLYFFNGENPLVWIFHLLTEDAVTIMLLASWILWTVLAVLAVMLQVKKDEKATTAIRKIFHLLAILVFAPGIILKPCLLYFASGVVFAMFIFLDTIRILAIPPIGRLLQEGFAKFSDEKDEGPLALTPIYLLVGCALPLWLHPAPDKSLINILPLISGLLSVGIGDSAASICGSMVGRNKWPGSKKTKEGTASCFLSQLFIVIALIHFGYVPRTNLIKPTFAIAVCSLLEARTDQIDNVVLPLLMYIIMMM